MNWEMLAAIGQLAAVFVGIAPKTGKE